MSGGRIGVFVCSWGSGKDPLLDMENLRSYADGLEDVVVATCIPRICSESGRRAMVSALGQAAADRFVVVACSPKSMDGWYRSISKSAGLHPLAFEVANVRDRAAFVHEPPRALEKARRLIRVAVEKMRIWSPPPLEVVHVSGEVAVVGDGLMACLAARDLASHGIAVHLISSSESIRAPPSYLCMSVQEHELASSVIREVLSHPLIRFHGGSRVMSCQGRPGDLGLLLAVQGASAPLRCGAVVLAPEPETELRRMDGTPAPAASILASLGVKKVAILPSGSSAGTGCSCITPRGILYALEVLSQDRNAEILLLGREIRAMGGFEEMLRLAQLRGARLVRIQGEPSVLGEGPFEVRCHDEFLGDIAFHVDIVLRDVVGTDSAAELAHLFGMPVDEKREILGFESRLKPGKTVRSGVFASRYRVGNMLFEDMTLEAGAAAAGARELVGQGSLEVGGSVAEVDQERCSACLSCMRICPYDAPHIGTSGKAEIRIELCQGCGVCVGLCPSQAIDLYQCTSAQLLVQAGAALRRES